MRDVLLVLGIGIISLVALRKPAFGMVCFVGASLLNPHSLTWGFARSFPFAQWIAVGTLGGYFLSNEDKKFPKQREFFLLLALWAMFIASTPLAIEREAALHRCILTSKILLMVFLSMSLINSEERLRILIRVIALTLGFHGLKGGIFAVMTGGNYMVEGPENSFLAANNAIGLALAMNVPILFHLSRVEKDKRLVWLLRAMLVFSYPAIVCTFSRGAWLGLTAATVLVVLKLKTPHKVLVLIAAVILVPVVFQMLPERVASRYEDLRNYDTEDSAQSRFWNWELCTRVGFSHPLLGGGFDYYSPYIYDTYFPEFLQRWPGRWWSCHSMWFTVLGEHGLPGIILYIALIVSSMMSLRRVRAAGTAQGKPFLVELANMLQGAFVAYMVSGTFLDVAYFDLFYQLVAVVIIVKDKLLSSQKIGVGVLTLQVAADTAFTTAKPSLSP
jgi:putative inorganic carbon (HCO3(-)) transporter